MTTDTPTVEAQPVNEREQKALEIAAKSKLTRKGNNWIVPSQAGSKKYTVNPDPESPHCTCPDFVDRQARCKHIFAVEYTIQREQTSDGQTIVTESVRVTRQTYTQDWQSYNAAQTNEKAHFLALLYQLCTKVEEPIQTMGLRVSRSKTLSLA